MLKQGQQAPSFTLPGVEGGSVTLEDDLGKPVVLYLHDPRGVVRKLFPTVKLDGHAEKVLEALREIQAPSER